MNVIQSAYDQFCEERFPLPTEEQVAALEERIRIRLPSDYRQYLLQFNGGFFSEPEIARLNDEYPDDALTFMYGIGATHPTAEIGDAGDLGLWTDNDPPQIVPIGYTVMAGRNPGTGRKLSNDGLF